MLPRAHRLSRSAEFRDVVRRGARAGSGTVVLHEMIRPDDDPVRVGFVVSRTVGNAVMRNRVKRRLRDLMSARLDTLAPHTSVVVRANPASAEVVSHLLGVDLDGCLATLARRRGRPPRAIR